MRRAYHKLTEEQRQSMSLEKEFEYQLDNFKTIIHNRYHYKDNKRHYNMMKNFEKGLLFIIDDMKVNQVSKGKGLEYINNLIEFLTKLEQHLNKQSEVSND